MLTLSHLHIINFDGMQAIPLDNPSSLHSPSSSLTGIFLFPIPYSPPTSLSPPISQIKYTREYREYVSF